MSYIRRRLVPPEARNIERGVRHILTHTLYVGVMWGKLLLSSSQWRPGMLLNILQCGGLSHTTENYLFWVSAATKKFWPISWLYLLVYLYNLGWLTPKSNRGILHFIQDAYKKNSCIGLFFIKWWLLFLCVNSMYVSSLNEF